MSNLVQRLNEFTLHNLHINNIRLTCLNLERNRFGSPDLRSQCVVKKLLFLGVIYRVAASMYHDAHGDNDLFF